MKLVVFGLSISSSWGNGHATTYRALLGAVAARGHQVVFYEWDAPWYREHRDLSRPDFLRLELYTAWEEVAARALAEAAEADVVMVGSYVHRGPEVIDALAGAGVDPLVFYDIDTPVTMAQLRAAEEVSLRRDQVPLFGLYLSFSGGPFLREVVEGEMGARRALPLHCCVDEERYHPVAPDPELGATLAYMGTYAPDRQPFLEAHLLAAARRLPGLDFLLAGPQYPAAAAWPPNLRHLPHLPPSRHPALYSSARWQLNATRADMVRAGWAPSVRLFEAAACGAALLSDRWAGLDSFLTPGREILLPEGTEETVRILTETHDDDRRAIGAAARARVLAEHTATRRARELEAALLELRAAPAPSLARGAAGR